MGEHPGTAARRHHCRRHPLRRRHSARSRRRDADRGAARGSGNPRAGGVRPQRWTDGGAAHRRVTPRRRDPQFLRHHDLPGCRGVDRHPRRARGTRPVARAQRLGRLVVADQRRDLRVRSDRRGAHRSGRAVQNPAPSAGLREDLPRRGATSADGVVPRALRGGCRARRPLPRRDDDGLRRAAHVAAVCRRTRTRRQGALHGRRIGASRARRRRTHPRRRLHHPDPDRARPVPRRRRHPPIASPRRVGRHLTRSSGSPA